MEREWALVLLTAVLVAVTGYYAWQNRQMVIEMRRSRRLSVTPKISITMFMLGPTYGVARLVNVGQGPGLDVDITISFHRVDESGVVERKWQSTLMPPGETHDFFEPEEFGHIQSMEDLAQICSEITIKGTAESSLGDTIVVNDTTGDLKQWFEMSKESLHLWEEDARRKIPGELEKARKELERIRRALETRRGEP